MSALTQETIELLQRAGITTGTGLTSYDLQTPAVELVPVVTPLRNWIPRVKGAGDTATHWKAVTGINTGNLTPGVAEGNRNAYNTTGVSALSASYKALGFDDVMTWEAQYAAFKFTDLPADTQRRLLLSLMISEEQVLFGGQGTWALGQTPTPTVGTTTTTGALPTGTAYVVYCVALTLEGLSLAGGFSTIGSTAATVIGPLQQTVSRTGAGSSSSDTVNGGTAIPSASGTATTGGGGAANTITASIVPVAGAAGYAWYMGTNSGTARLAAITALATTTILIAPTASQLFSALASIDYSQNSTEFDGLTSLLAKSGSGSLIQAGTGAAITSDGAGGIAEMNTFFSNMYKTWKTGPTDAWCSSNMAVTIDKLIVGNSGAPIFLATADGTSGPKSGSNNFRRPGRVSTILNKANNSEVDLHVHPNCPDGMIMFTSSKVPFPSFGRGNPVEVHFQRDYHAIDWLPTRRAYEYGIYTNETLALYAPGVFGLMHNYSY
jgi:hypothetical protein